MDIETKLALVESSQRIVGIRDRMFVHFYEQSLFGWQLWVALLRNSAELNPEPTI
ncbi:hypothetical protein VCR3J2_80743 [Vibrio coralliirubri]|uniref:hypothetical protein n=1 Tax=Vibrio coralliirubri TaxID=1516159 RepID=UPI00062EEECE|nr:hypothetical protein [Vibrio coralliirubri]CDU05770.1 hypothetical protein VCR3J2_80743 [Vibrio coralliirubri]